MHLCPLGHWTRTHYSNCGNGNFRCRVTLTSYPVAASAWMFKQGTGISLLPIKSLWNSWSAACHCGLQVQQGFTIPGALCQNKSTTLLGQGKGSGCVLLWQGPSRWLGRTLFLWAWDVLPFWTLVVSSPALSNPFWNHLFQDGWFRQGGGSALAWQVLLGCLGSSSGAGEWWRRALVCSGPPSLPSVPVRPWCRQCSLCMAPLSQGCQGLPEQQAVPIMTSFFSR